MGASLELQSAVLDPAVEACRAPSSEAVVEDEEFEKEDVGHGCEAGEYGDKYKAKEIDVADVVRTFYFWDLKSQERDQAD